MTTKTTMLRLAMALALSSAAACGAGAKSGAHDMAHAAATSDMGCYGNATTSVELLNACTTAQTGDPAKDAPYYPSLAAGGNLPPLP